LPLLLLFDLALETAMRLRECYTLTLDQIDLPRRTIFLDRTKNGDNRQVPLSSVAVRALEPYAGDAGNGLLFPWWDGATTKASLRRTTSRLSRAFARIADAAGCGDLRFHDLRHEATCRLFERTTLSDLQISLITGHRDPRMLRRYANLRASDLAAKMW
jgi:integrase